MKSLTDLDIVVAAQLIGCEAAAIKAVCEVEAPRGGFLLDGKPTILFEPYIFGRLTLQKYDNTVIEIDKIFYPISLKGKWDRERAMYGLSSIQHYKLEAAKRLDEDAALKSCSWGKFQILGGNYKECGFESVNSFVQAMYKGEKEHLLAFVKFIKSKKLDDELRNKSWALFAASYNGPGYKQNKYDIKLQKAYERYIG